MESIKILHNSQDLKFRSPFGAVKLGEKVKLSVAVNKKSIVYLYVIDFDNKEEVIFMPDFIKENEDFIYFINLDGFNSPGLVKYYFKIATNTEVVYYGNNVEGLGGIGEISLNKPKAYQITVYKEWSIPNWYKEGIIYQIFVDRFNNGNDNGTISNPKKNSYIYGTWEDSPMYIRDRDGRILRWDFYGGNLKGIIQKLEYIKSLGATIIYMNPIFEASSCHKYDTGDFEKIDGMFGTEEDFKNLCNEAEKIGIRIILDGVFSHTGADSKYFNKFGNYQELGAFQSPKSNYFNWYRFYEYPHKYECWWGIDNQPNIDELNPNYLNYIVQGENSIIAKWLRLGASGWRLDVADELPDTFIKAIKSRMKEVKKDSLLIGEVWEDASNKISYNEARKYLFGEELDSVTNYPLRVAIIKFINSDITALTFRKIIMSIYENYPKESFYSNMNLLGNHDTERIFTLLGENINKLQLAIAMQMTLPGVPLVYYGDEAGLTGAKDPENRKPYPWGRENAKVMELYRELLLVRKTNNVLVEGELRFMDSCDNILIYERYIQDNGIILMINTSAEDSTVRLDNLNSKYSDINSNEIYSPIATSIEVKVMGNSYRILMRV